MDVRQLVSTYMQTIQESSDFVQESWGNLLSMSKDTQTINTWAKFIREKLDVAIGSKSQVTEIKADTNINQITYAITKMATQSGGKQFAGGFIKFTHPDGEDLPIYVKYNKREGFKYILLNARTKANSDPKWFPLGSGSMDAPEFQSYLLRQAKGYSKTKNDWTPKRHDVGISVFITTIDETYTSKKNAKAGEVFKKDITTLTKNWDESVFNAKQQFDEFTEFVNRMFNVIDKLGDNQPFQMDAATVREYGKVIKGVSSKIRQQQIAIDKFRQQFDELAGYHDAVSTKY